MESSIDISTINLTLSTSHLQIEIDTTDNDEIFSIVKNKIGRQDLEQYFKNFNRISQMNTKAKHQRPANYVNETIWYLRHAISNYTSRTEFDWKFERIGVELETEKIELEFELKFRKLEWS